MQKIIFLFLLLAVITTGCQKAPDTPIVVARDIDNMIEKAGQNPIITNDGEELRQQLHIPEQFTLDTESRNGNLKIHAAAEIITPNTASIPVAKVTMGQFGEEDVKNLYEALCGDSKPISPDAEPMASYYMQQVQSLNELKKVGANENMNYEEIDLFISEFLEKAANAPTSHERMEPDFSFKENQDMTKEPLGQYARLRFMPNDDTISEISVTQDSHVALGAYAEFLRDNTCPNKQGGLPSMKQDDAQKLAEDIVMKLGLTDFACTGKKIISPTYNLVLKYARLSGINEASDKEVQGKGFYEFMFTRKINNVPIIYTDADGLTTIHDAYYKPWMYEKICISIDDDGVCSLKWNSPYIVTEIVSDASAMLPFPDIQDIFTNMIPVKYDHWDNDDRYSYCINVTEARLGLMRITEKDVGDSGLLIPVWDFFGILTRNGILGEPNPAEGDDNSFLYNSFLTINAIDGSIIDRNLGY